MKNVGFDQVFIQETPERNMRRSLAEEIDAFHGGPFDEYREKRRLLKALLQVKREAALCRLQMDGSPLGAVDKLFDCIWLDPKMNDLKDR